jgi:hypothetical protein
MRSSANNRPRTSVGNIMANVDTLAAVQTQFAKNEAERFKKNPNVFHDFTSMTRSSEPHEFPEPDTPPQSRNIAYACKSCKRHDAEIINEGGAYLCSQCGASEAVAVGSAVAEYRIFADADKKENDAKKHYVEYSSEAAYVFTHIHPREIMPNDSVDDLNWANLRLNQASIWISCLGLDSEVPGAFYLTPDEIDTAKRALRAACVQWAISGSADTSSTGSPIFWGIVLSLEMVAQRPNGFTMPTEALRNQCTLMGLHEKLKQHKSKVVISRDETMTSNTWVRGADAAQAAARLDQAKRRSARYDELGAERGERTAKVNTIHRLLIKSKVWGSDENGYAVGLSTCVRKHAKPVLVRPQWLNKAEASAEPAKLERTRACSSKPVAIAVAERAAAKAAAAAAAAAADADATADAWAAADVAADLAANDYGSDMSEVESDADADADAADEAADEAADDDVDDDVDDRAIDNLDLDLSDEQWSAQVELELAEMAAEAEAEAEALAKATEAQAAAAAGHSAREDAYKGGSDPRLCDDGNDGNGDSIETPSHADLLRQGKAPRPYYQDHAIKKLTHAEARASQNFLLDPLTFTRKWRAARDAWRVAEQLKVDNAQNRAAILAASKAAREQRATERANAAEAKARAAGDRKVARTVAQINGVKAKAVSGGKGALYAAPPLPGQAPTTITLVQAPNTITAASLKRARSALDTQPAATASTKPYVVRCAACNCARKLPLGSAKPNKSWVCEHAGDAFVCGVRHTPKRSKQ